MNLHERFEALAALELIGELSAQEHRELQAHLTSCQSCRREYKGLESVLLHRLPLLHEQQSVLSLTRRRDRVEELSTPKDVLRPPNELQFLPHGDLFSKNFPATSHGVVFFSYAAGVLLVIALGVFSYRMREQSMTANGQVAELKERVSILSSELQNRPSVVVHEPPKQAKEISQQQENQHARLALRTRGLEQQLNASAEEIRQLRNQLESTQASDTILAHRVSDAQEKLERASNNLQTALLDRDQTSVNLKNKETELLALEQEVADLRSSVDRDRALLAASHDITNLMGARNLRIIDVSDVDGRGKTRKAFGRVFFTEGKSLVFYAFDLPQGRSATHPASFQVWGAQGANLPSAKSLGIFFHDDHNSNRWVLKFDDPSVLSEIDSVFVTVEPLGGSKRPTGTLLLPAYLKAELNHP